MTDAIDITIDATDLAIAGNPDYGWSAVLQVTLHKDNSADIDVIERHNSENGTPMDQWHQRTLCWSSHRPDGVVDLDRLEALKRTIAPLLQIIADNREVIWDGNNHVGRLTSQEARDADEEVTHIVADYQWWSDEWTAWNAGEWILPSWQELATELGLQHDSDSNVQAEAAKRLVELAEQDKIKLINVTEAIDWIIEQLRENRPVYTVSNYASDGSWCEANPAEFHSLEEAREEVGRRLGDLRDWRKWSGLPDDNDVEAYHASREDGCGGVAISKE